MNRACVAGIAALGMCLALAFAGTANAAPPPPPGGPHTFYYGFLLSSTDAIILILYIIAFVSLSDYVVPTRILLGSKDGTSCYFDLMRDAFTAVVLQQCVLAQHGYWWTMGAM